MSAKPAAPGPSATGVLLRPVELRTGPDRTRERPGPTRPGLAASPSPVSTWRISVALITSESSCGSKPSTRLAFAIDQNSRVLLLTA